MASSIHCFWLPNAPPPSRVKNTVREPARASLFDRGQQRRLVGSLQDQARERFPRGVRDGGIGDGQGGTERLRHVVARVRTGAGHLDVAVQSDRQLSAQGVALLLGDAAQQVGDRRKSCGGALGVAIAHLSELTGRAGESRG